MTSARAGWRLASAWVVALGGPVPCTWLATRLDLAPFSGLSFIVPLAFAAVVGGVVPAVVATLESIALLTFFVLPPKGSFDVGEPSTWLKLLLFAMTSALVVALLAMERRRRDEAHEAERRAAALNIEHQHVASILLDALLPRSLPAVAGVAIEVVYRPARLRGALEVGGDFYDVVAIGGRHLVFIGDVSGKGERAAALLGAARHTLRATARHVASLEELLQAANSSLMSELGDELFVTVAAVSVGAGSRTISARVCRAGHPPPLLVRRDGRVEPVGESGHPLGVVDAPHFRETSVSLREGDALVLYTDGVTDARSGRELFGDDRLERVLSDAAGAGARGIAERLDEALTRWTTGAPRDDIAVVVIS